MVRREIPVRPAARDTSYRMVVAAGLRRELGQLLLDAAGARHLWLVSDTRVARLYGEEVAANVRAAGWEPTPLTIRPGEGSKSWATLQRLTRELVAAGADRSALLVALGGGVVGDVTGFLASIYLRGVPVVQVPTTLLAMVDAAIGGKTGINLAEGKNLVGTFHQPRQVVIDPEFLLTLPWRERLNGVAELVKTAFIRDADLVSALETAGPELFRDRQLKDREKLTDIICRTAAHKAAVVSADEREGDLRRILNFGHTLGHAYEKASGYRLAHGAAVALGMLAALEFSVQLTGLEAAEAARGRELLRVLGLPRTPPRLDPQAVLAALQVDKKRQGERLVFVLLRRLGEAVICPDVPRSLIARWLVSQ